MSETDKHPCHECKHRRRESMGFLSPPANYCDHPIRGGREGGWGFRVSDDMQNDTHCGSDRKLFVSVFSEAS